MLQIYLLSQCDRLLRSHEKTHPMMILLKKHLPSQRSHLLKNHQTAPLWRRMTKTMTSGPKAEKHAQGVECPLVTVISALTVSDTYISFVAGLSEMRDMARMSYAGRVISSNAAPCRLHQTALPRLPRAHRVRPSTARRYRTVLLQSSIAHQIRMSSSILALIQPHRLDFRFIYTLGNYAQKLPLPKFKKKPAEPTYDGSHMQHLIAEGYSY